MSNILVRKTNLAMNKQNFNPRLQYIISLQAKTPTKCPRCEQKLVIDDEEIYCPNCGIITETSIQYVAGQKFHLPHGLRLG